MTYRKSRLAGGYWGWFYQRSTKRLMIALNEGGREIAFNIQLWRGIIPCGYYLAVRVWGEKWFRSHHNLKV